MIAYCWASGRIDFGRSLPDGAIELASGPSKPLRDVIEPTARLAYDGETWLVPGVPEAASEAEALEAVDRHVAWLARSSRASRLRGGVRFNSPRLQAVP